MRITAAMLCLALVLDATAADAQSYPSPVLQVAGPATPGAIVSINLAGATPHALAVAAYGFVPGQSPIGGYATLGLVPAGFLVLGTVSAQGTVFSGIQLPNGLPVALNGLRIYFQGAILRVQDAATGLPVAVDLTPVQFITLDVSYVDPTGVTDV